MSEIAGQMKIPRDKWAKRLRQADNYDRGEEDVKRFIVLSEDKLLFGKDWCERLGTE